MNDIPRDRRASRALQAPPSARTAQTDGGRTLTAARVLVCVVSVCGAPADAHAQEVPDASAPNPVGGDARDAPTGSDREPPGGEALVGGDASFPCTEMLDEAGNVVRLRRSGIVGLVRDSGTRETIIEGAVQVVGEPRVFTNVDGCFQIELPPGTYTLRVSYDLYQTARVENVVVRRGEATEVIVDLQPDTDTLQEVVVTARADRATEATQLELRRQSASVSDSIGAQEIARSPDNTAGEAVRRVVAATVVGGQYLYVRGLGGRYTNTLMNGAPLPSLDPDAPGVQLDLFPSNVLTALTIHKTFTPDLPGDMVGGAMAITTREFPTRFRANLGLSLGVNTITTFANGLGYSGGSLDWLGFDDGTRALPATIPADRAIDRTALTPEQLTTIGRSFQNVWNLGRSTALPNFRVTASAGDTVQVSGRDLGYLLTAAYGISNQRLRETVSFQQLAPSPEDEDVTVPRVVERLARESMQQTAALGVLGTVAYRLGNDDQLSLTSLFANAADDYAGFVQGRSEQFGDDIAARRLRWLERNLWWNQLAGEHKKVLGFARIRWQLSANVGRRSEPDTRDLTYGRTPEGFAWLPSGLSGRIFSELWQRDVAGSSDLAVPVATATLKVGGAFRETNRDFWQRRFRYEVVGPFGGINYLPPEELFGTLDDRRFWNEFTRPDDGYRARQSLYAAFAMVDWPVTEWLRIAGGFRAESFRQTVDNRSEVVGTGGTTVTGVEIRRTNVDLLPSAALIFQPLERLYIRTSYGRTLARPLVRELSLVQYPDFVRRRNVVGNPDLRRTLVDGFDVRVEWFPSAEEVLAASFFYKAFVDPIESGIQGRNNDFSFQNARGATNYGAEFEVRLSLGRLSQSLRMFGVGANFTFVDSEVSLSPEDQRLLTSLSRPLAGQSPYVANVSLGFAPPETGFSARLYYNVFGPRLIDVGKLGLPDIYQRPFHSLDVTVTWEATPKVAIRGSVENLLDDDFRLEQGGELIQGYRPGLTFGVGVVYTP